MEKGKCVTLTDDALIAWAEMLEDMAKMVFCCHSTNLNSA